MEAERQIKLPAAYRGLVKAHRGDIPVPSVATVGKAEIPVNALFFVRKDYQGDDGSYNAWDYIEQFDAELPADISMKLVPFTSDSGQGVFVFDYRRGSTPSVSLIDLNYDLTEVGEGAIAPAAESFEVFLDNLHD